MVLRPSTDAKLKRVYGVQQASFQQSRYYLIYDLLIQEYYYTSKLNAVNGIKPGPAKPYESRPSLRLGLLWLLGRPTGSTGAQYGATSQLRIPDE